MTQDHDRRRRDLVRGVWLDWFRNLFRLPTPQAVGRGILSKWAFLLVVVILYSIGFRIVTPRDAAVLAAANAMLPPNADLAGAEARTQLMRTANVTLLFDFVLTGTIDQPAGWYASLFGPKAVPIAPGRLAAFFEFHNRIAQLEPAEQRRRVDAILLTSYLFTNDLFRTVLPKLMSADPGLLRQLFAGDGHDFDRCIARTHENTTVVRPELGIEPKSDPSMRKVIPKRTP